MSELERNRGNLYCVGPASDVQGDMDCYEFSDYLEEKGMLKIGDNIYTIVWYVESDTDCSFFAEVTPDDDGTITFHTMHYNGGGSLEEVLEPYVKKIEEEQND